MCGGTCIPCPAGGFFQNEIASTPCKICSRGQLVPLEKAPGKGPLDCLTCPKGTDTNASARYRACPCLDGYSRAHRFGECTICTHQGFSCERDYVELAIDYWMFWDAMPTASNKSCKNTFLSFMKNLDTKNNDYDRGTIKYNCSMPTPHRCTIRGSCLGGVNATCERGYTGILCAVCDKEFMKTFGKCNKCPSRVIAVLQFVGFISSFIFICWIITLTEKIR